MFNISDEAKKLYSTFFAYRNDIDIYTEDEDKDKEFYNVLFGRLIDKSIIINEITPLGSSSNVIRRCQDDVDSTRKKVYIIDGDTRLIHGNIPNHKNLFVLDAYCIENFLIDEESVSKFMYMSSGTRSLEDTTQELNYETWLNTYCKSLMDLFFHFAIIDLSGHRFNLFSIHKFFNKGIFQKELVEEEIQSLKVEILAFMSEEGYNEILDSFKEKWVYDLNSFLTIVSGKDYLIPMVLMKSQHFKASKALPSLEELKLQLVHACRLDRLESLKLLIERTARN